VSDSAKLPGRRTFLSPMPAAQAKLADTPWALVALTAAAAVASVTFAVLLFINR
jgi:hypothetical protein